MALSLINQSDINPLKRLYNEASSGAYPWFNETDWQFALKDTDNNGAENYLSAILSSRKLPFNQDKVKYLDSSSRISYLYNQILRENTKDESKKQEYQGVINKIEQRNEQLKEQYYLNIKDQERANMNFFKALGPNIAGFGANLGAGILETWDRIKNGIVSGSMWIADQLVKDSDKTWADTLSELGVINKFNEDSFTEEDIAALNGKVKDKNGNYVEVPEDEKLLLRTSTLQKGMDDVNRSIAEWEADHTSYRNYDGSYNYKSFQSALGSVFSQVGRVQGNMLAIAPLRFISPHLSTAALYTSFGISDATETYRKFRESDVSINATQIILNSTIKMIAQRAIEGGLEFVLGPDVLARTLLGRKGTGIVKTNVSNLAAKRFLNTLKGMGEEALEEVLQDTSDFLINKATAVLAEESAYNDLVDISFNGMMNTAVVAALSALLGSSLETIRTKNVFGGKRINVLQKMDSAQLDIDLRSVAQSLQKLEDEVASRYLDLFGFESIDQLTTENIKEALRDLDNNERNKIFIEVQKLQKDINTVTSLVNIAKQVLDDMGEQGLQSAINNLDVIRQKADEGYFDLSDVQMATDAAIYIADKIDVQLKVNELTNKLKDHGIKKLWKKFTKKSDGTVIAENISTKISDLEITPEQKEKDEAIVSAIMKKTGAENVVISKEGSATKLDKETLVIPLQFFADAKELYRQLAEDYFYENLKNDQRFAPLLKLIVEYESKYLGRNDISERESIYYLMDKNIFHALLTSSDSRMYRLMEYLLVLEKSAENEPLRENIVAKLQSIRDMWLYEFVNYAALNFGVDYSLFLKFVPDDIRAKTERLINRLRIKNQVFNYYRSHEFSRDDDYAIKNNYVQYLERYCKYYYKITLSEYLEKRGALDLSKSNGADTRILSLLNKDNPYEKISYTDMIEGKYLEDTSIANRMFNNYLLSIDKDLQTILDVDKLTDSEKQEILDIYNVINTKTLLQYRNKILQESTDGSYTLRLDKVEGANKLAIVYNDNVVTFGQFENFRGQKNIFLTDVTKNTSALNDYVIDTLDDSARENMSIDDIINNPDLFLSDNIKKQIVDRFGKINSLSTLLYLRRDIEEKTNHNESILYSKNGYVIGNFEIAKNILRDDVDITTSPKLKDIVKSNYYIKNIDIEYDVLPADVLGYYVPSRGVIQIDYDLAMNDPSEALLTILHEYSHVLQEQYGLVSGFGGMVYYNRLSEKAKRDIRADIIKHVGTFDPNMLYQCTGESLAFGYGSTHEITFVPLIPGRTDKYWLITPWGHAYTYDGRIIDTKKTYRNELIYHHLSASDIIKNYLTNNNIGTSNSLDLDTDFVKEGLSDWYNKSESTLQNIQNFNTQENAKFKSRYFNNLYNVVKNDPRYTNMSFEEFMNTEFPVVYADFDYRKDGFQVCYFYNFSDINLPADSTIQISYIKPSEISAPAIDASDFTILVSNEVIFDPYKYDRSINITDKYDLYDPESGELLSKYTTFGDITISSPGNIVDENVFNSPSAKGETYDTYNKRYKDAVKKGVDIKGAAIDGNPTKKGGIPKFDKDGNQQFDKSGKPIYVYPKQNREGRRVYIGKKEAEENKNYKGFITKAQRARMTPEMKEFVKNAKDLPPSLQKKIENGTLTEQDVMDYFREKENIPDEVFTQINDAFFGNEVIKNSSDLNKLTTEAPSLYAYAMVIYERVKYYNEKGDTKLAQQWQQILETSDTDMIDFAKDKINNDSSLKERYEFYFDRYEKTVKGRTDQSFIINEQTLKTLFMKSYDGSLESAGKLISAARYLAKRGSKQSGTQDTTTTGQFVEGQEEKLTKNIGEDVDTIDIDLLQGELSYEELQQEYVKDLYQQKLESYIDQGVSESDAQKRASMEAIREVMNMDRSELEQKHFEKIAKDSTGEDYTVESISDKVVITPQILKNRIDGKLNNLKRKLTGNQWKRFIKEHQDLLNEDGKIKRELYITKQQREGGSALVDKLDSEKLEEVTKQLDDAIYSFRYVRKKMSKDDLKQLEKLSKLLQEEKKAKPISEKTVKKERTIIENNFVVDNNVVTISTTKPIPEKLKTLLQTVYTERKKTMVQEVTEENQTHAVQSMNQFFEQHNRTLQSLSKQEAIEIVNFYLDNIIESIDQNYREQYHATQLYTLTYIFKQNKLGFFQFTKEELSALKQQIGPIVSADARGLAIWGNCLKYLNPEKATMKAVAKGMELQFNEQEMEEISKALQEGDFEKAMRIKEQMYENTIKKYGKGKQTFLQKLWNFERACMLSSPSTWIRNYTSNWLVKLSNRVADKIGYWSGSKLLDKIFKDSKKFDGYKLTNTKVSDRIELFIRNNKFDKLYDLVADGMTKYDVNRQIEKYHKGTEDLVKDMIVRSITAKYNLSNQTDVKIVNSCIQGIYHMISDDKFVKNRTLELFGKILTEDNIPLNLNANGVQAMDTIVTKVDGYKYVDPRVINAFVKAFNLASYEYMHTSNFVNDIENVIKNRFGPTGFILYKQVFPFLAPSVNWAVEALRFTPMNLVKSIIDYAKLEKKAQSIEERAKKIREHGFQPGGYDRSFVKYMIQRNIGKGIIGTIGFGIGAILAGLGVIQFNDDDDKYELKVGNISVDVSSLYGTSGLLIGGTLIGGIRKMSKDDNTTFWKVLSDTMNVVADNTLIQDFYNTFRFGNDILDIMSNKGAQIPLMLIPNIVKVMIPIFQTWGVTYSNGVRGVVEKYFGKIWPYGLSSGTDIYTGDRVARYGGSTNVSHWSSFFAQIVNKFLPLTITPNVYTKLQREAIALGINKSELNGRYNEKQLIASQKRKLNQYYGKLNNSTLTELMAGKVKYTVKDDKGNEISLTYNKMSDKQKKDVITRIMSNNAQTAKVWYFTENEGYKYYTSESEYQRLKKLGIKNVYKKDSKRDGLIK